MQTRHFLRGASRMLPNLVEGLRFGRRPVGITTHNAVHSSSQQRDSLPGFTVVAVVSLAIGIQTVQIDRADGAEVALVELVTGGYFSGLGIRSLLGRAIGPEDDVAPGAQRLPPSMPSDAGSGSDRLSFFYLTIEHDHLLEPPSACIRTPDCSGQHLPIDRDLVCSVTDELVALLRLRVERTWADPLGN